MLVAAVTPMCGATLASAQDVSAPAILQWFEGSYKTIERRSVDVFVAGYGAVWTPPPGRADSGNQSVGYDQYNRFDLGVPGAAGGTLYGTETGLKQTVSVLHRAGKNVYVDLVWNHNGFRDSSTSGFVSGGGYPGFVLNWPGTSDGDFHSAFAGGDLNGRLSGLIDIDHSQNIQLIRQPVNAGDTRNIPAGQYTNLPNAANARFYPDRDSPGRTIYNNGQAIAIYDFNLSNPMAGDAVPENATGYLMRNAQWLVQTVGVDGFRLDATKHMETWVLEYLDIAVFNAIKKPLLDGSQKHVFSFGEYFDDDVSKIQSTIRKDIGKNGRGPNDVGGNRDALDFPLFSALGNNLSSNGVQNDWRNVIDATLDRNDDGLANNGSQGIGFVASHDSTGPALSNVAHAFVLMRPGNANVYFNAKEFGGGRDFPKDGRGDALGGLYGGTITTLVDIRNRYGRGNFLPRLVEKETLVFERENSILVGLSNRSDTGFDSRTAVTAFPAGMPLIELTGNASDPSVDPNDDIPALVFVNADRTVNFRVPRNGSHGKGYVIYGPATPQGAVTLSNVTQTLGGQTPTSGTNGTARLSSLSVIKADSFTVSLQTNPVYLLGTFRDADADGDNALLRFNEGVDVNGNGRVDIRNPGSSSYGFETFTQASPLTEGGSGLFVQTVDATKLPEGVNFLEVRAFRKRPAGSPEVYSSWRQGVYIDRLPPDSTVDSFNPTVTGVNQNRRVIARSVDLTADNIHVFLDLPVGRTDAQILAALSGSSQATNIDRDLWQKDFSGLTSGNHVLTVVTFEETGTYNIQRFPGYYTSTIFGAGLGDLDFNGLFNVTDVNRFGSVLLSFNQQFNPAADLNGDGYIDWIDLYMFGPALEARGASEETMIAYRILLGGVIPEPTAALSVITLAPIALSRRTRRPRQR